MSANLYHGDCLKVMQTLNAESIDLIVTDPPFGSGRRYLGWKDIPEGEFYGFFRPRLWEAYQLLRPTGSMWVQLPANRAYWADLVLRVLFGQRQHRSSVIWHHPGPANPRVRQFPSHHEVLLWFSKGREWTFHAPRVPYKDGLHTGGKIDAEAARRYEKRGRLLDDVWDDIPAARRWGRLDYGCQKPVALYERIIAATSNPGDVVLDPFCGSSSVGVAATKLGRGFIGIDSSPMAIEVSYNRLFHRPYKVFGVRRHGSLNNSGGRTEW